jgi:hypothetical protein
MENNDSNLNRATKESILAFRQKSGKIHEVQAFNGIVYFKEWTSGERDNFESSLVIGKGKSQRVSTNNIRAKMFVRSVCDKDGKLIFTDEEASDVGLLPAAEVDKVYAAIQKVNSVSDDDVEELAGNSNSDR